MPLCSPSAPGWLPFRSLTVCPWPREQFSAQNKPVPGCLLPFLAVKEEREETTHGKWGGASAQYQAFFRRVAEALLL